MHLTSSDIQPSVGLEPIPGYVLEKRIGTGGYGEVWRASAPGGLSKAVKFVFGNLDEARAGREMRSLSRIKGLQHPFLLSLERIEVIDGKLLIVTELARCCLKDRFDECKEKQLKGIPRDELLVYLRDAADALDFLSDEHSLQHLDVKPENLLLVGSHVKISDFGLVKDLTDNKSLSLVDGLTPKYSPPEILDNRPGKNSDQYSLAIVYQEMLTGKLPFTGTTTAQLASQHVHATPNLSPLPPSDRFAVRKALSKNPERRFQSCREFVDYLINPPRIASVVSNTGHDGKTRAGEKSDNGAYIHDGRTQVVDTIQAKAMPGLNVDAESFKHKPTLFIGIGGIACRILHRLGQRLDDRYGGLASVPAVKMLMLDTDVESINALAASDSSTPLNGNSILALPLRNPQEYRRANIDKLQSISRRWLYNIPRSRKTEGLRALGRLAFLDHSARIVERLRQIVQEVTNPESVKESAKHTGLPFEPGAARVYIIASTSGGTGGGMLLDVGYAVRQTLAEHCLSDENVHGLLLHTTPHNAQSQGLAFANTNAVLEELLYFARPDTSFPGEPSLQLAGFREDALAFPNTYVVPLGDGISSDVLNQSIDRVAEYIYLNCAAKSGVFFEMCRDEDDHAVDPTSEVATVRTFGVHALSETNRDLSSRFGDYICKVLVTTWRGGPNAKVDERPQKLSELQGLASLEPELDSTREIDEAASQFLNEESITEEGLSERLHSLVFEILQGNPEDYFERVVSDTISVDRGASTIESCASMLETILGAEVDSRNSSQLGVESLPAALAEPLKNLAQEKGQTLARTALRLANISDTRVEGARHTAYCMAEKITCLRNQVAETTKAQAKLEATALRESLQAINLNAHGSRWGVAKQRKEATRKLIEYALARLHEVVLSSLCDLLRMMELTVTATADDLRDFWQELTLLKNEFQHVDGNEGKFADRDLQRQWDCLLDRQHDLVKQLDELGGVCLVGEDDKLARHVFEGENLAPFALKLRRIARRLTLRALKTIQRDSVHDLISEKSSWAETLLNDVSPELTTIGGEKRLLLTSSNELDAERLADCLYDVSGEEVTIVKDDNQDCVVCYEVGGLRLRSVANYLIKHRSDVVEMSRRLRTRIDIDFG